MPDESSEPTGAQPPPDGAGSPGGSAPEGEAGPAEQPAQEPQGLSPADLEAVLKAAGFDAETAPVAGTDEAVGEISAPPPGAGSIDMLKDVALNVRVELGRTEMLLEDVLRLGTGAVLTLDKLAGDTVDVLVNGQLVARGEVMVLDDNFCVRITEIVSPTETAEGT